MLQTLIENGSIYITKKTIYETKKSRLGAKYIMENYSAFEVDTKNDLNFISAFLKTKNMLISKKNRKFERAKKRKSKFQQQNHHCLEHPGNFPLNHDNYRNPWVTTRTARPIIDYRRRDWWDVPGRLLEMIRSGRIRHGYYRA